MQSRGARHNPEMARILLGVSGGIAAYKACELTRLLVKGGHDVSRSSRPEPSGSSGPRRSSRWRGGLPGTISTRT